MRQNTEKKNQVGLLEISKLGAELVEGKGGFKTFRRSEERLSGYRSVHLQDHRC